MTCRECGSAMMLNQDGTSNHLTGDIGFDVDYDKDGEHVAVVDEPSITVESVQKNVELDSQEAQFIRDLIDEKGYLSVLGVIDAHMFSEMEADEDDLTTDAYTLLNQAERKLTEVIDLISEG